MFLIDLTHTSHTAARTGIQRVSRSLVQSLGPAAVGVTRDPYLRAWRPLEDWERAQLADGRGRAAGTQWPLRRKWHARVRRGLGRAARHAVQGEFEGLIEPELFSAPVARDLPKLLTLVRGPRVALFHDALALRQPDLTPAATVARLPAYLQELLRFDGIAAVSADSRDSLLSYWQWLGIAHPPPVVAIPLAADPPPAAATPATADQARPVVLSVGTIEGRKNHLALLEACEQLWAAGRDFELHLVGHLNAATGRAAVTRIRALQGAGRPLRYDGPASDEAVAAAYAASTFTVYPSLGEGFGLPVIESLVRGRPCVCSSRGAIGEISRGGGCVALDLVDGPALARGLAQLLDSPETRATLAAAASARRFKTWADYTRELTAWMQTLPRR
jgi:glycosyltransferase involved in cell wall biosynthesis